MMHEIVHKQRPDGCILDSLSVDLLLEKYVENNAQLERRTIESGRFIGAHEAANNYFIHAEKAAHSDPVYFYSRFLSEEP